jgi:aspartate kinase
MNVMKLLVQKYGGSSLSDSNKISKIAKQIGAKVKNGFSILAVVSAMGNTTDHLISLAKEVSDQPQAREMDLLLSTGEMVSCTLMAMALRTAGYNAIALTGAQAGIQTNTTHGKALISSIDTTRIKKELENGNVVIVAGFQGVTEELDITTLGRGGSDTTAVALAAAMKAEICEIYTDVDGIYTANPKLVPNAIKLSEVGYEEMLEMANYGAKMHPRSIELGMLYNVPILVTSAFGNSDGTLIHEGVVNNMEMANKVTGIAVDTNVSKITVLGIIDRPGIAASVFEPLAEVGISVDVIVQNASVKGTTDLTFTVSNDDLSKGVNVITKIKDDIGASSITSSTNLSKISIVGTGIQNAPGIAAQMFRTLFEENVNIEMITTSEIRITCIVDKDKAQNAAHALHSAFQLENQ